MKKAIFITAFILVVGAYFAYQDPTLRGYFERKRDQVLPQMQQTRLYKWRDQHGQWQVSSEPPPEGVDYEVLEYDHDTNVMPKEALTGERKD